MRDLDLKSLVVAGVIGLLAGSVLGAAFGSASENAWYFPASGFGIGVSVQLGLRLFGVS